MPNYIQLELKRGFSLGRQKMLILAKIKFTKFREIFLILSAMSGPESVPVSATLSGRKTVIGAVVQPKFDYIIILYNGKLTK